MEINIEQTENAECIDTPATGEKLLSAANFGKNCKGHWFMEPDCTYINHGAFGALSKPIHQYATKFREQIERQPAKFFYEDLRPALRRNANLLGEYLKTDGDNIVFVENATTGLNAILRSLVLLPGEEVVTTDHAHPAVVHTLSFICERAGARLKVAQLPFPTKEEDNLSAPILDLINPRTAFVVMDHITSSTALILPVQEIADECRDRNIPLLVDGAQAPGQIPINIDQIDCTWYVGSCHKWFGAPKGASFIWTSPDYQSRLRPTAINACMNEGYHAAFDWPGIKDFTPCLIVDSVLALRQEIGEENIHRYCHDLAVKGAQYLCDLWGSDCGSTPDKAGNMMLVHWPSNGPANHDQAIKIRNRFREEHNCEVEIRAFAGKMWLRISAWLYNDFEDYKRVGQAGLDLLKK